MDTLSYLCEVESYLFKEGDALMSTALAREPYDTQARSLFKDGMAVVRCAESLWPLIHWYRSFETSYWALRNLKPTYDVKSDPRYCWVCGELR